MGMRVWAIAMALAAAPAIPTSAAAAAPLPTSSEELRQLRGYDTSGDPEAALRHVDAVLARASTADPIDLLYAQAVRARALSSLDRTGEALALFRQVEAGLETRKAPLTPERASLLLHIGSELGALGKLDEAQDYTARALALAEKLAGAKSPEYAEALYGLALIDYQRGQPGTAIPRITEALAIARAHALATGEDLESPADYGISLAALQLAVSDPETAVVTAREAAAWAEAHLPENHRVRVATAQQLGTILSEAGQFGQAIPILRATLEKRRAILPPGDPKLAMSLHALAFALDNAGMRAEAAPLYDKAVATTRKCWSCAKRRWRRRGAIRARPRIRWCYPPNTTSPPCWCAPGARRRRYRCWCMPATGSSGAPARSTGGASPPRN
jgi:tetratricopeptide (TPR) repeat protein